MATWLNKILNVRPGEWSKLLVLCGIMLLSNLGYNWGMTIAYASFLKGAGLETLIWVLLLSSLLSIPVLAIYAAFVDRIDNNTLFAYTMIVEVVIIILSMGLLGLNFTNLAFPFLYVLALASGTLFNTHFFTYVNEIYDIQVAKRALPLILATGRIGAALSGFSLPLLTKTLSLSNEAIIWIWLVNDALVIALIWAIPRVLSDMKKNDRETTARPKPSTTEQKSGNAYLQNLKEGLDFTLQSNFLRWMAIGSLLLTVLMTMTEYQVNALMVPEFEQSQDFASFLGVLTGVSNVVSLVILLFVISRLTKAWGVGNTSMLFPSTTLAASAGLVLAPGLVAASMAHLNRRGLRFSLLSPIESLLYNAISFRIKGRARAFVSGLVTPIGVILGVVFLLIAVWFGTAIPILVPSLIAVLGILYIVSGLQIRKEYTQALIKMLEEEDYSFLLSEEASELVAADPETLQRLQKKLDASTTHEMRIFMTQLIAQVGGAEAVAVLMPAIKNTAEPRTRAAMLSVLAAAGLRGNQVQELYMECLSDGDSQIRQAAASGLEQLLGAKDPWMQGQLLGMANDPDTQVSLYALQSLANTGEFYKFNEAVQKLDELSKSKSVEQQKSAIDILGKIARPQAIEKLLAFLANEDDQLRLEAILEIENLSLPTNSALDEKILERVRPLCHDPVARVRQSAITLLGKFKQKEDYALLVNCMADKNPQVRNAVVDVLVHLGKDTLPVVQAEVKSPNMQKRKMAAVVLSRINPRQFTPQVEAEISDNLEVIFQNVNAEQALAEHEKHRSVRVLQAALREENREMAQEILYFLSAIHGEDLLKVVQESLLSSTADTRSLALEALESLTSPKNAALIAALFDSSVSRAQLISLGHETLNTEPATVPQVLERLVTQTDSEILALLAVSALEDLYLEVPTGTSPDAEKPAEKSQLSRAARLLMALETPTEPLGQKTKPLAQANFSREDLAQLLEKSSTNPDPAIQSAANTALEKIKQPEAAAGRLLTLAEKVIIIKETVFFRNVPINQLETLAKVCVEERYEKNARIFSQGDPGGILYVVAEGSVGIEQEKRAGSTLLATVEDGAYFGEMSLFDNSPRSASAIATRDSVVIELNRAPIMTLTMQSPDLALELINVLGQRIRETSERMADAARSRPRELHKLFDQFG